MRYIFILLFLSLGLSALAQQNIVESLQRNRAVDGGLIGGAALKVVDFKGIIDAFK